MTHRQRGREALAARIYQQNDTSRSDDGLPTRIYQNKVSEQTAVLPFSLTSRTDTYKQNQTSRSELVRIEGKGRGKEITHQLHLVRHAAHGARAAGHPLPHLVVRMDLGLGLAGPLIMASPIVAGPLIILYLGCTAKVSETLAESCVMPPMVPTPAPSRAHGPGAAHMIDAWRVMRHAQEAASVKDTKEVQETMSMEESKETQGAVSAEGSKAVEEAVSIEESSARREE
ncbi:hypothetical protein JB92DRAFT_3156311 [Gautieria morchelliformis]|nr:hypothetical protein JB92DRAFT_3156311 [Gautieria morchelliformis]